MSAPGEGGPTPAAAPDGQAVQQGRPALAWSTLAVIVALALCALVARLPGAVGDAMWQDEIGATRAASQPTAAGAIDRVVARESTPPAFYLLAWATDKSLAKVGVRVSTRMPALRALSVAFGVGCTVLTVLLALAFLPLWGAGLAGLLVALGPPLVVHGAEIRAYSLLAFAVTAFALALRLAAARPSLGRLALLAGAIALGTMTHYFFLFTFAAGVLWVLVWARRREVLLRVGITSAIGLVPLAVWSPNWHRQYEHRIYGTARPFTLEHFLDMLPSLFAPQPVVLDTAPIVHGAVTLVVLASSLLLLRRPEGRLCALCVLVPFAVVSLGAGITGERVYSTRNLIGVAPFAAIAIAWACASLPWRPAAYATGALAGGLVLGLYTYSESDLGRTPYDRIADALISQGLQRGDPIVWLASFDGLRPVSWYLTRDWRANAWPRLVVSRPSGGTCPEVAVVVRSPAGRRWLEQNADAVLVRGEVPDYGDELQGRRHPDAVVARLAWRPGVLERLTGERNTFFVRVAGTPSPCLTPPAR